MDFEAVYIRTSRGEAELGNEQLALELHDILSRIDGKSDVRRLMQDASFWSEETFESALKELLEQGCIRLFAAEETEVREPATRQEENRSTGKSKFAQSKRTLIASVLFLDIVEYTKQSVSDQFRIKEDFNRLLSDLIRKIPEDDRIIIDTGDGAALGFLADPEEVLFIAIKLRDALEANDHKDHPDLYVRMGINLGPVKLVADMNGRENLIGDGVNDANRVMGFARGDQILVSRSFYDVVSRLSNEHYGLFKYQGIHKDKHRREHEIYEVAGGEKTPREEKVEEKTEEEVKAERLEKMQARLDAAAKAEADAKAAMAAQEKAREVLEAEMRKKAEARIAAEKAGVPKKRSGVLKLILIAAAVLIVIVAALLPFVPLEFVAKNAAVVIADKTQETVTIENAYFSLFPTPRITLKQVSVGQDLKIAKMTEALSMPGSKAAGRFVLEGVTANQDTLSRLSGWGGQPLALTIELINVNLSLNGVALPLFGGEIDLTDEGAFVRALVSSEGMKAQILPGDSGAQIELSAKNWKLPMGPDCPWEDVHAKAVAKGNEINIGELDASGYGGDWSGSARISWGSGWHAEGSFKGKNLDLGALMPFFSADARLKGALQFNAGFASVAGSFEKLFDSPRLKSSFSIKDGEISNVDIAQAIKSPSPDGTRGGETKFDSLSGIFARSGVEYHFDQLKLASGLLKAVGNVDVRSGKLGGRMEVDLNRMHAPLTLGGSLSEPVVR
ncbi:MAG: hypothetical protein K2P57_10060 [Burkholderiales bacterium]|nr:hypothetical protein [Burkholderiales bacterium]